MSCQAGRNRYTIQLILITPMNSNRNRWPGGQFLWFVVACFSIAPAFAADIVVTNPGDQPVAGETTLREAIAASAPNDVITFAVDQYIVLTEGELVIDHNLQLRGPDVGMQDIRRADGVAFRLFRISGGTVACSHLTLRNGYADATDTVTVPAANAQGGAILNAGTLSLTDCFLTLNSLNAGPGLSGTLGETGGNGEGGAIYNSGTLTVFSCTFDSNRAVGGNGGDSLDGPGGAAGLSAGGAIYNSGSATVSNSTFCLNGAGGARGGNASVNQVGGKGGATQGGAIFNAGSLAIYNSTFFHNSSNAGGAGGSNVTNDENGGDAAGGAIFASSDPGSTTTMGSNLVAGSYLHGGIASDYFVFTYGMALGQNVFGPITSSGFNLIEDAIDSTGWIPSDQIGTPDAPIDPLLQTYDHDNGGPTPTHSFKPGSLAIDQGKSYGLTTDQRGLARIYDDPAVPNATGGDGSDIGSFELQPAPPALLQNVSTRVRVGVNDSVLIGGLIVTGTEEKTIVVRGLGQGNGFDDPLVNPYLELHDADGAVLAANDDWFDTQASEIELSDLAPEGPYDSAILRALLPGAYTAIVRGLKGGSGTGLVEAYDIDQQTASALANISSRGKVGIGDNVMIGGFILGGGGGGSTTVVVRALGPSLGLPTTALQDPTLELHDVDGVLIGSNDNWKDTQEAEISAAGLAPAEDREAALLMDLPPGDYTAVVRGKEGTTGVALVEVYRVE